MKRGKKNVAKCLREQVRCPWSIKYLRELDAREKKKDVWGAASAH